MPAKVEKLVLDAGPLINQTREEILSRANEVYTTPSVLAEVKDESARQRLELLRDDLKVKQPSTDSSKFVNSFAAKTGDSLVLSVQDIEIIALAYELHPNKEALRTAPEISKPTSGKAVVHHPQDNVPTEDKEKEEDNDEWEVVKPKARGRKQQSRKHPPPPPPPPKQEDNSEKPHDEDDDSDWSDDGWITTENVQEKLTHDGAEVSELDKPAPVALASRDFAVQNVALQIGIILVNENGLVVKQLKNFMQRCHACFKLIPLVGKPRQFCPRCGGHTLTRVTVSVKDGKLQVHLKRNMQWHTRGDRYSLPNPQSRRARRLQHDDKVELYAEDQPEYEKAVKHQRWQERRDAKTVEDWTGPTSVASAVSPFAMKREPRRQVRVGRGRYANAAKRK